MLRRVLPRNYIHYDFSPAFERWLNESKRDGAIRGIAIDVGVDNRSLVFVGRAWLHVRVPDDAAFTIIFPSRIGNYEADHFHAFPYLLGMATLALTEDGWEVEGSGRDWAHWVSEEKLIYVRGFGPLENRRIPFRGRGVTAQELDALAERLIKASQWKLERP